MAVRSCRLLLAGGTRRRLRSLIGEQQKCMASYAGQPFLFHLFASLYDQGFTRVVLGLGYDAERVQSQVCLSSWCEKITIVYSVEERQPGIAGGLRHALPHLRSDEVIVLNGDTFARLDYRDVLAFYGQQVSTLTLAVTQVNTDKDSVISI